MRINLFLVLASISCCFFATGCETPEQNKLAEAQQCLDKLSDSATAPEAQNCLRFIAGINSASAYVIRCSVDFISGGVTPTALVAAYTTAKALPKAQQPAALMGALTQYDNVPAASVAVAQATYNDCVASDTPSLIYLAGISVTGTAMVAGGGSTTPATFISNCKATPSNCSPDTIGAVAQNLATTYCSGDNATSQECIVINSAVAAGAGNPTAIGTALFNLLQ